MPSVRRPAAARARLLFVGAPPPRIARSPSARARAASTARVLVLGHRDDVPAILTASDVVVDASYAGLGITGSIREALACERPVVGHRPGGHARAGDRRRDGAAGAAARARRRWPQAMLRDARRSDRAPRRWRGRAASAWRRTSRCAPSSTPPRRSTAGLVAGRAPRVTHAAGRLPPAAAAHAALPARADRWARCWPWSWPPWRAPSRGW